MALFGNRKRRTIAYSKTAKTRRKQTCRSFRITVSLSSQFTRTILREAWENMQWQKIVQHTALSAWKELVQKAKRYFTACIRNRYDGQNTYFRYKAVYTDNRLSHGRVGMIYGHYPKTYAFSNSSGEYRHSYPFGKAFPAHIRSWRWSAPRLQTFRERLRQNIPYRIRYVWYSVQGNRRQLNSSGQYKNKLKFCKSYYI